MMNIDLPLDEIIKSNRRSAARGNRRYSRGGRRSTLRGRNRRLPDRWERGANLKSTNSESKKLLISNLSYHVNDDDIRELFSDIGPIKKSYVNYDKSGRSHGTAEVIYHSHSDMLNAVNRYNNVPLDGRPMKIEPVTTSRTREVGSTRDSMRGNYRSGNAISRFSGRFRRNRGGRSTRLFRGSKMNGGVRKSKSNNLAIMDKGAITKESLDADLEAYKRIVDNASDAQA